MKEEQKEKSALSESLTKLSDIFSTQRKEEDGMIAELHSLSKRYIRLFSTLSSSLYHDDYFEMFRFRVINVFLCFRLEENKLKQDEDVISIAKCRFEIKNMKEEMIQLHDANMYDPGFFMTLSYYITSKWFHTFICVVVSQNQCRDVQKNSGGTGSSVGQTQYEQVCSTSYFYILWYIFFRELNC